MPDQTTLSNLREQLEGERARGLPYEGCGEGRDAGGGQRDANQPRALTLMD